MKARKILASLLAAGCLSVACFAEAATVALLPLIDKSSYEDKEEVNATYVGAAIRAINASDNFTLVDNESLGMVLDKNLEPGKLPSPQTLKTIAEQAGVDVVIATQLETLDSSHRTTYDGMFMKLDLAGTCYYYNTAEGKVRKYRMYNDIERDATIYSRSNFELEYWSDEVRRAVNRAIGNKKIKLEKPKLGW